MRRSERAARAQLLALFWGIVLLGCLSWSGKAGAQDATHPPLLTGRGRYWLGGGVEGFYSEGSRSPLDGVGWALQVSPEFSYFLRDHVALGASIGAGAGKTSIPGWSESEARDVSLTLALTGTFELPLGARLGLLFRPLLGYLHLWRHQLATTIISNGEETLPVRLSIDAQLSYLRLALPVLFLIKTSDSVGIGLGPDFWVDMFLRQQARGHAEDLPGEVVRVTAARHAGTRVQVGFHSAIIVAF